MRSLPILLAAALVGLACDAALATLTPPERASRGPLPARAPEVAMNARGDAAAVWVRGERREAAIVVSTRPAGGSWGSPVAISRRPRPALDPEITIDPQGQVVVVWRQIVGTRLVPSGAGRRRQAVYVARTRERPIDAARWSPITTLSSRRQKVGPPELAVGDDGLAVAAWHWGTGNAPSDRGYVGQLQFVERRADGSWSGPTRVSRSSLCTQVRLPRVAVGARGHAVLWWQCDLPSDRSTALAVTRAPGAAFGAEVVLPFEALGDVRADLAVAADGRAVAVSAAADGVLSWWRGEIGATLNLSALPGLGSADRINAVAGPPAIAVNGAGDALSAWVDPSGRPRAAPIASGLGVGEPSTLGPAGISASLTRVAVGDGRHGAVSWVAGGRVLIATRATDGTVSQGEEASVTGASRLDPPSIAMDQGGGTTLMWTRSTGGRAIVERATGASP